MTEPTIEEQPTEVVFAGLGIPVELAPTIIAALRRRYPGMTEDMEDEGVVRAMLKYIIEVTVIEEAALQANLTTEAEAAEVQRRGAVRAEQARARAQEAVKRIREVPSGIKVPVKESGQA